MSDVGNPARHAVAIGAGSDTVDLTNPTRSLFIGTAGNLTVKMYPDGEIVTFTGAPAGILPIQVLRVNQTGLTAANVVALW
jgi:hypothetical protein